MLSYPIHAATTKTTKTAKATKTTNAKAAAKVAARVAVTVVEEKELRKKVSFLPVMYCFLYHTIATDSYFWCTMFFLQAWYEETMVYCFLNMY